MERITAHSRYIRQSARKVRLVADLVRGLPLSTAFAQLSTVTRAARLPIEKVLHSALANASHNFQKEREGLFIQEIQVNEGAALRRWRPRAFGRAAPIRKHSCHISVVLGVVPGAQSSSASQLKKSSHEEHGKNEHHVAEGHGAHHEETRSVQGDKKGHTPEVFDHSRTGRHETAQLANKKEKKVGFMKKIIQRKTG